MITEQARRVDYAWVSGDTQKAVSVSDLNGKRLGRFSPKKTQLLKHSTGLLVNLERLTKKAGEVEGALGSWGRNPGLASTGAVTTPWNGANRSGTWVTSPTPNRRVEGRGFRWGIKPHLKTSPPASLLRLLPRLSSLTAIPHTTTAVRVGGSILAEV